MFHITNPYKFVIILTFPADLFLITSNYVFQWNSNYHSSFIQISYQKVHNVQLSMYSLCNRMCMYQHMYYWYDVCEKSTNHLFVIFFVSTIVISNRWCQLKTRVQGNKQTTRLMQAFLNTCSDFYMEKKIELIIENKSLLPFFEALHLSSNDFLAKDKPNLCKLNVQLKR